MPAFFTALRLRRLFSGRIVDMNLGRFEGIHTLNSRSLLFDAIALIADEAISAIPVVNDEGVCLAG